MKPKVVFVLSLFSSRISTFTSSASGTLMIVMDDWMVTMRTEKSATIMLTMVNSSSDRATLSWADWIFIIRLWICPT